MCGKAKEAWQSARDSMVIYGIVALNAGVSGLWRQKRLQGHRDRMIKWLAMPLPPQRMRPVITALTSTFSHAGLAHLGINMMALRIFGSKLSTYMGGNVFLAFYLTAGMVSSLGSYAGRLRSLKGGHSMGASGAVYACLAAYATLWPEDGWRFTMLPEVCIRPSTFLPVMMGAEALGLLMGWRKLDHLANLTGALFGILYARMILHILAQIHAGEEAKLMHNVSLAKDDLEEAP